MSYLDTVISGNVLDHGVTTSDINTDELLDRIRADLHPTQKPVELAEMAINTTTLVNNIILDFFGGSGSTLIAAERTNRHAYLMELDPKYCDVIVKRWEDFTGNTAKRVSSN